MTKLSQVLGVLFDEHDGATLFLFILSQELDDVNVIMFQSNPQLVGLVGGLVADIEGRFVLKCILDRVDRGVKSTHIANGPLAVVVRLVFFLVVDVLLDNIEVVSGHCLGLRYNAIFIKFKKLRTDDIAFKVFENPSDVAHLEEGFGHIFSNPFADLGSDLVTFEFFKDLGPEGHEVVLEDVADAGGGFVRLQDFDQLSQNRLDLAVDARRILGGWGVPEFGDGGQVESGPFEETNQLVVGLFFREASFLDLSGEGFVESSVEGDHLFSRHFVIHMFGDGYTSRTVRFRLQFSKIKNSS